MSGPSPVLPRDDFPPLSGHQANGTSPTPVLSSSLTSSQAKLKRTITCTITAAKKKLERAQDVIDDAQTDRDEKTIRDILQLHKDVMGFLAMLESDCYFHNYVETKLEEPLDEKEKYALRLVASAHLNLRKRDEVVSALKLALDGLADDLNANNNPPTLAVSEEDLLDASEEIEKTPVDEGEDFDNLEEILEIYSSIFDAEDNESEPEDQRVIPQLFSQEEGNGNSSLQHAAPGAKVDGIAQRITPVQQPIIPLPCPVVRQLPKRSQTVNPVQPLFEQGDHQSSSATGSSSNFCPCCSGHHALHQCVDVGIKRFCAIHGRCIYCTSSEHTKKDCPLFDDLSDKPAPQGPADLRGSLYNNSSTPINHVAIPSDMTTLVQEPKKETARAPNDVSRKSVPRPHFVDSDEDEDFRTGYGRGDTQHLNYREVDTILGEFNGDPLKFKYFSAQFEAMVMKNTRFPDTLRYAVLKKKLVGKAQRYLVELDDAAESITATFRGLKLIFGEDVSAVNEALCNFEQLRFSETDFKEALCQVTECTALIKQLKQFGEDTESRAFSRILTDKFPVPFVRKLWPLYQETNNNPSPQQILDFYETYLRKNTFEELVQPLRARKMHRATEIPSESVMIATVPVASGNSSKVQPSASSSKGSDSAKAGQNSSKNKKKKQQPKPQVASGVTGTAQGQSQRPAGGASYQPSSGSGQQSVQAPAPKAAVAKKAKRGGFVIKQKLARVPELAGQVGEVLEPCYNYGIGIDPKFIAHSFPREKVFDEKCCFVCGTGHSILQCPLPSFQVREHLRRANACHNCARAGHSVDACESTARCVYCQGCHNTGGCTLKEFYRDLRNYPLESPKPVVDAFFRGPFGGSQ